MEIMSSPAQVLQCYAIAIMKLLCADEDTLSLCQDPTAIRRLVTIGTGSDEDAVIYESIRVVIKLLSRDCPVENQQVVDAISDTKESVTAWMTAIGKFLASAHRVLRMEAVLGLYKYCQLA